MWIHTDRKVCTAGINSLEYEIGREPGKPLYLVGVNLEELDTTVSPEQTQWDFGNVWIEAGDNTLSIVHGVMACGQLSWRGRIPMHEPYKIHAQVYHAYVDVTMKLNLLFADKGDMV